MRGPAGVGGASTVSVVVPVKDGARYLAEVLDAIASQEVAAEVETLVIDSGSRDRSVEIARRAGARVVEIAPEEFGHGRTRNLAMELARGQRVAFLTQDATPASPAWLASLLAGLSERDGVGLAYGPHLPRPGTSTAVARELEEFFAGMSPDGRTRVQRPGAAPEGSGAFFSNVNSCVERACWAEVRFREVAYAEDQAFARDALAAGWAKAYVPAAGVLHAHDYSLPDFMRRYFDEYRGLRFATGHVEPVHPRAALRTAAALTRRDLSYAGARGAGPARRAGIALESAAHHGGRALFAALGSRAERLPAGLERRLSLEGTGRAARPPTRHGGTAVVPRRARYPWDFVGLSSKDPGVALAPAGPGDGDVRPLHVAWVIPPWRAGSGGHKTLLTVASELERLGHSCSVWIHDPWDFLRMGPAQARREIVERFAPVAGGVFKGLEDWMGADVAMATGWQSAYAVKALGACKLKAYFVQDHEPSFEPWSAQAMWAQETYRAGMPCVCASPWLRDLLRERYGADAESFELAIDHTVYREPEGGRRDPDTVVLYARQYTPRRGTELGILALAEVLRRRPRTRVVMYGGPLPPEAPFPYEFLGVTAPERLAELYAGSAVGMVLSLTNYSLVPQEMMACGLPVVDVAGASSETVFGADGELIALAEPEPGALADQIVSLLEDPARRARVTAAAREFVAARTWPAVARTVEGVLRERLRRRALEAADAAVGSDPAGAAGGTGDHDAAATARRAAVRDLYGRLS